VEGNEKSAERQWGKPLKVNKQPQVRFSILRMAFAVLRGYKYPKNPESKKHLHKYVKVI